MLALAGFIRRLTPRLPARGAMFLRPSPIFHTVPDGGNELVVNPFAGSLSRPGRRAARPQMDVFDSILEWLRIQPRLFLTSRDFRWTRLLITVSCSRKQPLRIDIIHSVFASATITGDGDMPDIIPHQQQPEHLINFTPSREGNAGAQKTISWAMYSTGWSVVGRLRWVDNALHTVILRTIRQNTAKALFSITDAAGRSCHTTKSFKSVDSV